MLVLCLCGPVLNSHSNFHFKIGMLCTAPHSAHLSSFTTWPHSHSRELLVTLGMFVAAALSDASLTLAPAAPIYGGCVSRILLPHSRPCCELQSTCGRRFSSPSCTLVSSSPFYSTWKHHSAGAFFTAGPRLTKSVITARPHNHPKCLLPPDVFDLLTDPAAPHTCPPIERAQPKATPTRPFSGVTNRM
jgi:hypothetical protein